MFMRPFEFKFYKEICLMGLFLIAGLKLAEGACMCALFDNCPNEWLLFSQTYK